jgi:cytoskeletal protein RodZ
VKIVPENTAQVGQDKMITAGEVLKAYREKKGLALSEVSAGTKIPLLRLKQIEEDSYGNFESQVFTRGFIKNYAEYLGLDVGKVLAIYRRSTATTANVKNTPAVHTEKIKHEQKTFKEKFEKAKKKLSKFEFTPTTIASISGILLFLIVIIYLSFQFYYFQKPPQLSIVSPENNITTDKDLIEVKGVTEIGAAVKINNLVVQTNTSGEFNVEFKLTEGSNKIIVKSYKNNNEDSAAVQEVNVLYKKASAQTQQEQQAIIEEAKPAKHTVQIEIIDEDTWITLIADDKQMIAWVVGAGKTDVFEFERTVELTTGKPRSTKFLIDGKETQVTIGSSGTGGSLCTVTSGTVKCE